MSIKVLADPTTLGSSDPDIVEITLLAGSDFGEHLHGSTEIFYVLSGELEHIVSGSSTRLRPGMVGSVRPPDRMRHRTTGETKALVLWHPGEGRVSGGTGNAARQECG